MRQASADRHPAQAIAQRMRAMEAELLQARQALRRTRHRDAPDRWRLEQPAADTAQEDSWFLTYLDMMTLMLVAMVVMLAFSGAMGRRADTLSVPPEIVAEDTALPPIPLPAEDFSYQAVSAADFEYSAPVPPSPAPAPAPLTPAVDTAVPAPEAPSEGAALAAALPLNDLDHEVEVIVNQRSISFRINSEILFDTSQTDLSRQGLSVLQRMAKVLSAGGYDVTVEGHTDAVPVRSSGRYPSNWELSSARAGSVVRYLQANGIRKAHLKAVGYADSRPIASNQSAEGRARNRRVELIVEKPPASDGPPALS